MAAHAGYIIAAYAVTGVVLGGMLLAVLLDHRAQAARLATLSDQLGRRPQAAGARETTMSHDATADAASAGRRRGRGLVLLPLIVFIALAVLFLVRLGAGDPSRIPSALIGKPVPDFALAGLPGLATSGPPGLTSADLRTGHVTLVNVFASWCAECHDEHDALLALADDPALKREGATLAGIVYKDDAENARRYLGSKGNPFARVGTDPAGRTGIDFGVYGVPETFVVRGDGTIAYKLIGGVSDETRPALLAAVRAAAQPR